MRTYLVTGISRGLGQEIATQLLELGHMVYGTYNTNEEAAIELSKKFEHLSIAKVDMANIDSVSAYIAQLNDLKLNGIINCAGVFLDIDFNDFDSKLFEDTFRVNLFSPLYIVNGLAPNLVDNASIVNIASNDAFVGSIAGIAYSASKASLISITKSLANILADKKVRVNAVAPGWMGDGMQAPKELLKIAKELNPLKKIGSYKEVADVVLFLLSDKASYINGETITVDGGDMATSYILQKEAELL
jgi:NAD(P)-dependent dehydrogenase (short-subunit alcohol dehydrogenase family)